MIAEVTRWHVSLCLMFCATILLSLGVGVAPAKAQSCGNLIASGPAAWTVNRNWYSIGPTGTGIGNNFDGQNGDTASQNITGVTSTTTIEFDFKFINGGGNGNGNTSIMTIAYGGKVYLTISTPAPGAAAQALSTFTTGNGAAVAIAGGAAGTLPDISTRVKLTLPSTVPSSGTLTLTATNSPVTGTGDDVYFDNFFATPSACVDPGVTKTDAVTTIVSGAATTYTITATNGGPAMLTGGILTDPVVPGLNLTAVACGATPGLCTSGNLPTVAQLQSGTFALPAMAFGQTYQIAVTATITAAPGSITNTATFRPPTGVSEINALDDTASDTNTVTKATSVDLGVTKSDGVPSSKNGAVNTYVITVTNNSTGAVTGAILSDPAANMVGLTINSVACGAVPGQCVTPPLVSALQTGFALPNLMYQQTYQLSVTATVTATSGNIVNLARITAPSGVTDPVSGNNSATDTDAYVLPLAVTKTSAAYSDPIGNSTPHMIPGGFVDYTITVTNPNTFAIDSSSVVITDPTQPNLSLFVGDAGAVGSGPVRFIQGSPSSTLTFTWTSLGSTSDSVAFSNNGGTTWTYTPVPAANNVDALVTNIKVSPSGSMAAGSTFSILLRYLID